MLVALILAILGMVILGFLLHREMIKNVELTEAIRILGRSNPPIGKEKEEIRSKLPIFINGFVDEGDNYATATEVDIPDDIIQNTGTDHFTADEPGPK